MVKKFLLVVFLLFFVNFISADCFPNYECGEWGLCEDGLRSRTCVDTKCEQDDIVEREFCGEAEGCDPSVECGDWSRCFYLEKTNDYLNEELIFSGKKERVCVDKSGCIDDFVEEEPCSISVPIKVDRVTWCGEEYLEVFDEVNNPVARIRSSRLTADINNLEIAFFSEELPTYCSYCFDGVQNYDETGIDCGGSSCPVCIEDVVFVDWLHWVVLSSWGSLILFVFILIVSYLIAINRGGSSLSEKMKSLVMFFKPLSAEEAIAREQRITNWVRGIGKGGQVLRGNLDENRRLE